MARASSDALDALHAKVAEVLKDAVSSGEADNKILAVAIKFLKDNGIDAPASSPRFSGLIDELKNLDVHEDASLPN